MAYNEMTGEIYLPISNEVCEGHIVNKADLVDEFHRSDGQHDVERIQKLAESTVELLNIAGEHNRKVDLLCRVSNPDKLKLAQYN